MPSALLTLLLLSCLSGLWARPALEPAAVAHLLQQHQLYLQSTHAPLEGLLLQIQSGSSELHFERPTDSPEQRSYQGLYQAASRWQADLDEATAPEWALRLRAYLRLADRLDRNLALIESHVGSAKYRADGGSYLEGALHQVYVMLEDLRSLQQELRYWLEREAPAAVGDEAQRAVEALLPLIAESRRILNGLRVGQVKEVRTGHGRLRGHLLRLDSQQDHWQEKIPARTGSSADPRTQWQQVWAIAREFEALAAEFLAGGALPAPYQALGRGYYFYNHRLNPKFSAPGQGLVASYNRLINLAGVSSLPHPGELPWLKLFPKPEPEAKPKPIMALDAPTTLRGAPTQNLVFLVDVSGSMNQPGRLPLFCEAMARMAQDLRPEDHVSLVTFAGEAQLALPPTSGTQAETIVQATRELQGQGKTMILPGFEAGYQAAKQHFHPDHNNRLLIVTDGEFDIEVELLRIIEAQAYGGVILTVLAVGELDPRMVYRLTKLAEVGQGRLGLLKPERAAEQLIQEVQAK